MKIRINEKCMILTSEGQAEAFQLKELYNELVITKGLNSLEMGSANEEMYISFPLDIRNEL